MTVPLVFELSCPGRCAVALPDLEVPLANPPEGLVREDLPLPEVSEPDLVRHYTRLSQMNYAVDVGYFPIDDLPDIAFACQRRILSRLVP